MNLTLLYTKNEVYFNLIDSESLVAEGGSRTYH